MLPKIGTAALRRTLVPVRSVEGLVFPHPATTAVRPSNFIPTSGRHMGNIWND